MFPGCVQIAYRFGFAIPNGVAGGAKSFPHEMISHLVCKLHTGSGLHYPIGLRGAPNRLRCLELRRLHLRISHCQLTCLDLPRIA